MPIYKPSELRHFLLGLGISPKKSLSQNFLVDGNITRKIISAADVQKGDYVLEIGPGPGSLTEALLCTGAKVMAVEKDEKLAEALTRFAGDPRTAEPALRVFCEDITKFPLEERLQSWAPFGVPVKVIANLPYHLTTPIVSQLVPLRHLFSSLTVMIQEEVANRFTASPGTKAYGSFTVFLNFYSRPEYAFHVSRHCFYPQPKVDSAVVRLTLKAAPRVSDEKAFFVMTRTAFEHRRKMLRGSLRHLYPSNQVEGALAALKVSAQARPEELGLEQFISLFEILQAGR